MDNFVCNVRNNLLETVFVVLKLDISINFVRFVVLYRSESFLKPQLIWFFETNRRFHDESIVVYC